MAIVSRLNNSFALLLSTVLAIQPAFIEAAWGQQVIIDPNGNVGTRLQGGTSAPVVDIARPNAGGVSHNKYKRFDAPAGGGTVLNNSATGSNTAVAGQIAGNSNLDGSNGATTIINEVTSTEKTNLNGRVEVAGARANVIVANPNGLSCDGCSFLNTKDATLSTGVPVIDGATVQLDVARGAITIGRGGLDGAATGVGSVNLIGRTIVIDGKVTAIDGVNVQGGAQAYDLTQARRMGAGTPNGPAGSDYAIDGTAFGAMEAGRIQIVGNERGLGVRLRGTQDAKVSDVTVTNVDKVEVNSASAQRHVNVTSSNGDVEVDRDLSAVTGQVTITARNALTLKERSGVYGAADISLRSTHGDVTALGDLQSDANITVNGHRLSFSAYAIAEDAVTFQVIDAATFDGASVVAQKIDGSAFGRSVNIASSAFFSVENLPLVTEQLSFGSDVVIDGWTDAVDPRLVATVSEDFHNSGDLRGFDLSQISWGGNLYNEVGGVLSASKLSLSHGGQVHNSGTIYGDDSITLAVASLFNNETGAVLSKAIQITTTGDLVNRGTITAGGDLRLTAGAGLTNSGLVQATRAWLSGINVTNSGTGELKISGALQVTATDQLLNQGNFSTLGAITLAASQISNMGMAISEQAIRATAGQIGNAGTLISPTLVRLSGETITSSGTLASYDRIELAATGSFSNSGSLVADRTLSVSGAKFSNLGADALVRAKAGEIASASLVNSGKIFLIDNFSRSGDIDLFENSGSFSSAGSIYISGRNAQSKIILGQDSHLIAGLLADDKTQVLQAGKHLTLIAEQVQISGQAGRTAAIAAGGNIAIQTPQTLAIGGNVQTKIGNLTLSAADVVITQAASVYVGGIGNINSAAGLVNSGSLVVGRRLDLADGFGRLTNSGVLTVGQTGAFTMTGVLTNTGYMGSDAFLSVNAASIRNDGYLQAGTWMNLAAAGDVRLRGATIATGNISISAASLLLGKGLITPNGETGKSEENTGLISAAYLQIAANTFTNRGIVSLTGIGDNNWTITDGFRQEGRAHIKGNLTINTAAFSTGADSLLSSSGKLIAQGTSGAGAKNFDLSGTMVGKHVTISNDASIWLRSGSMVTAAGNIALTSAANISLAGEASAAGPGCHGEYAVDLGAKFR